MSNLPIFYCNAGCDHAETMSGFGSFIKRQVKTVTKTLGPVGTATALPSVFGIANPITSAIAVKATIGKKTGPSLTSAKNIIQAGTGRISGSDYAAIKPIIKEIINAWGTIQRNDPNWSSLTPTVQNIWNATGQVWLNNVRDILQPFEVNLESTVSRMTSVEINQIASQIIKLKNNATSLAFLNNVTKTSPGYKQGVALFDSKIAAFNKLAKMPRVKPGESGGLTYIAPNGNTGSQAQNKTNLGVILPIAAAGIGAVLLLKG